jgi:hypothetical protein
LPGPAGSVRLAEGDICGLEGGIRLGASQNRLGRALRKDEFL